MTFCACASIHYSFNVFYWFYLQSDRSKLISEGKLSLLVEEQLKDVTHLPGNSHRSFSDIVSQDQNPTFLIQSNMCYLPFSYNAPWKD